MEELKKESKEKIARVYAFALYEAAEKNGLEQKIKADVDLLIMFCQNEADLLKKMSSPLISGDEICAIWQQVAKKTNMQKETLICLEEISKNKRIGDLKNILAEFLRIYNKHNNIVCVKVESAVALSAEQDKKLQKILENKFNKKVGIEYEINLSLLGGLRVQSGSLMYDGSLSYKLVCLENLMKGK